MGNNFKTSEIPRAELENIYENRCIDLQRMTHANVILKARIKHIEIELKNTEALMRYFKKKYMKTKK